MAEAVEQRCDGTPDPDPPPGRRARRDRRQVRHPRRRVRPAPAALQEAEEGAGGQEGEGHFDHGRCAQWRCYDRRGSVKLNGAIC